MNRMVITCCCSGVSRCTAASSWLVGQLHRLASGAAVAVDQQVMGDPVEPRGKRDTPRPVAMNGVDHFQKHLLREVFGVGMVAYSCEQIAVDSIEVPVVELGQRPRVEGLGAADEGVIRRLQVAYSL